MSQPAVCEMMSRVAQCAPENEVAPGAPPQEDEAAFVRALQRRDRQAEILFYDRYADFVERIVVRILGVDDELPDLIHEAFVRALKAIDALRDARAITTWVTRVATSTAIDALRRRQKRRRWFSRQDASAENESSVLQEPEGVLDAQAALHCTYEILACLPPEERAAFVLRRIEGRELRDVASACGCSLATIKRRIRRAEKAFFSLAAQAPALRDWMTERGGVE